MVAFVRELVLRHFRKIISQEESAEGMLDAAAHLYEVIKDVLRRGFVGADVSGTHSDEEVAGKRMSKISK